MDDETDREIMQMALEMLELCYEDKSKQVWGPLLVMAKLRERLAQPEQEPVLQDIEQYRMQMASISTAAIGYWKEGDGIHPDYDTPALRDVADLYAKYELLVAQPKQKREWQGLFFDAVYEAWHSAGMDVLGGDWNTFASTLEAKLKEKTHEKVC